MRYECTVLWIKSVWHAICDFIFLQGVGRHLHQDPSFRDHIVTCRQIEQRSGRSQTGWESKTNHLGCQLGYLSVLLLGYQLVAQLISPSKHRSPSMLFSGVNNNLILPRFSTRMNVLSSELRSSTHSEISLHVETEFQLITRLFSAYQPRWLCPHRHIW